MARGEQGFTLIEMVIASLVLSVTSAAAFGLITASLRGLDRNKRISAAHDFLQTSVNVVRNTRYGDLGSVQANLLPLWQQRSAFICPLATFSITVTADASGTNLCSVQCWVGGTIQGVAMTLASTSVRVSDKGINP
ncbi:MAG TPA: hypothetical protein DD435_08570 [Cyanobacteria bacterium UBA8530]|nr:hypothetical protein [Cyanobacteria bacterium UBA8530]